MIVKIKTYGIYNHILNGLTSIVLNSSDDKPNVKTILDKVTSDYPELNDRLYDRSGRLNEYVIILKNGMNIDSLDGLSTTIEDGDEITLMPLISGG